ESLALWRPVAEAVPGDGQRERQPVGGAHPVAPRNVSSPRPRHLHPAGGGYDQLVPWPTTRSLLDQRGGAHRCSPTVSARVYWRTPPYDVAPSASSSPSPSAFS